MTESASLAARMLRLLDGDGILSTAVLARQLGISEGLVKIMAEDLSRRGYLAPISACCAANHGTCGLTAVCATQKTMSAPLLVLTAQGRRIATQP